MMHCLKPFYQWIPLEFLSEIRGMTGVAINLFIIA